MTYDASERRSVTLRIDYSIADAVAQRGLLPVVFAAICAWWLRPRHPSRVPARLRADIGLPAEDRVIYWLDIPINPHTLNAPDPLRRPGL